jgi:hypothetical protein
VPEPTLGPALDPRMRAILPEDGPTYDEIKRQQRAETQLFDGVSAGIQEVGKMGLEHWTMEKGLEAATRVIEHTFGAASAAEKVSFVGKAWLTFELAREVTEKAYDLAVKIPMERGKQLSEGVERDKKNLTLLMMVQVAQPDLLPDGYYRNEVSRVLGTDGKAALNQQTPFRIASTLSGKAVTDAELARARDILAASMREGVNTAYQMGIDSPKAFAQAMSTDATFRARYESDPAFRLGIQSVLWQATYHRDEYDTALSLRAGYRGTTRM